MLKNIKRFFSARDNLYGICLSTFHGSVALGSMQFAMPFCIRELGGSDREVGLALGSFYTTYLISCILAGLLLDKFNWKKMALTGFILEVITAAVLVIYFCHFRTQPQNTNIVYISILLIAIMGFVQVLMWPPIMGWVSRGYEGKSLTERFGIYNVGWSMPLVLSPFVAGILADFDLKWPLMLTVVFFCGSSVILFLTPFSNHITKRNHSQAFTIQSQRHHHHKIFVRISRVLLFSVCVISSLTRTQLALLITEDFQISYTHFGYAMMAMWMTVLVVFFTASKLDFWHYKAWTLFIPNLMLIAALITILIANTLWQFALAMMLIAIPQAFAYSAHQYYGVSGGRRRSGLMAIHEILISAGMLSGSIGGGFIAENLNRYAPYKVCIIGVIIALSIQAVIWKKANTQTLTEALIV